jgi:hypothetical protein
MYTLSSSKSIKGSNYGEFLKDKNVLLMYTTVLSLTAYKYSPNLESLLTQQYVCVMCTLWSDNTCVFTRFYSVKNANTQLIWSSASYNFQYTVACPSCFSYLIKDEKYHVHFYLWISCKLLLILKNSFDSEKKFYQWLYFTEKCFCGWSPESVNCFFGWLSKN